MKGVFLPILFLALLLLLSVSSGRELIEDRNENKLKQDWEFPVGWVKPGIIGGGVAGGVGGVGGVVGGVRHHPYPPAGKRGYSTPEEYAEFMKAHGVPPN